MGISTMEFERVMKIVKAYEGRIDKDFKIPPEEYEVRYRNVWKRLEEKEIDMGFFFWYREMPGDGIYLTGYNPTIERASGVIAPGKRPLLLAGPESGILSKEAGLGLDTSFVNEFSIPDEYYEGVERDELNEVISRYIGHEIKRIGYMTSDDVVPAKFMDFLHTSFGKQRMSLSAWNRRTPLPVQQSGPCWRLPDRESGKAKWRRWEILPSNPLGEPDSDLTPL